MVQTSGDRIELQLEGSKTSAGAIEFDALIAFGDAFRRAVRATARAAAGMQPAQPGQPPADVREASSLRVVGIRPGSVILELEPTTPHLVDDPAILAIQALSDGLNQRAPIERVALDALRDALRSLGSGGRVRMSIPTRSPVDFDSNRIDEVERSLASVEEKPLHVSVDGYLHALDIDPDEIRIRDTTGRDWICHYNEGQETVIRLLLGRVVRASGSTPERSGRRRIEIAVIEPLELPAGVGKAGVIQPSVLLAGPGAVVPQPLEELAADIEASDPEELAFEAALLEIR